MAPKAGIRDQRRARRRLSSRELQIELQTWRGLFMACNPGLHGWQCGMTAWQSGCQQCGVEAGCLGTSGAVQALADWVPAVHGRAGAGSLGASSVE
ncbi:hypothetical protein NDU88_000586 [Pleurodeles waltl]|uniref:Uncharacterized protein n=1 Tax=Pleurodeles waltl TaxID=8319 RepID=A0AAV7MKY7_PLEWA|nr:hypothetical protein NDU88_000586 [Pleurodeles waltl]